ncbi:CDP-diacylglycerol--glycerol-3-phosphate 3-phosphatidyltransferase [bacterium BMS3Bbin04]|nr:CDP-diacylglycerol--glycerol-3-phosphate 3-phosphatidyltransferase [bacterium BMS3Bbin04]
MRMMRHLPNILTSLRFPITALFVYGWLQTETSWHLIATGAFLVGMITDMLDGILARRMGTVSDVGSFLDPLADKVMVISGFYAILATPGFEWGVWKMWVGVALGLIVLRELGITVLRSLKAHASKPLATSSLGKLKTIVQMVTLIVAFLGLNVREMMGLELPWFEHVIGAGVMASAVIATISGTIYLQKAKETSAA